MNWPVAKRAGVCLHLTSLPGSFGIGELGSNARWFIDRLKEAGLHAWQFLPLGPTAYADSPYQPLSSFAGNPLLVDTETLVDQQLLRSHEISSLEQLPHNTVDFGKLIPLKTALLRKAATRFATHASPAARTAFDEFLHLHDDDWLADYALFRVLKTMHAERPWTQWEPNFRHRDRAALAGIEARYAAEVHSEKIIQFFFDRQWRGIHQYASDQGVTLFGDVPIYIAHDSADAWTGSDILQLDDDGQPTHVAGVPPDYFSADGQLWGNPVYDWEFLEKSHFGWWVNRFRHAMTLMDLLRVDHFRGFEAYWSIPFGARTARDGQWVNAPGDALFSTLRQELGELSVVAENLGVITPEVEKLRTDHDIPGMVVLQFDAAEPDFDVAAIDEHTVVYTGTHDNDTTTGWFNGGPGDTRTDAEIEEHQRLVTHNTGGEPQRIHLDMIELAFASAARLAVVPMQDFLGLGSETRMNTPGTESDNWRWRLTRPQFDSGLADTIAMMVADGGRD
ncbi:MAG: 4-alpha-glucanotransferase [Gammaproteobacteria bacterium]|nr:4-alpha-glucanotransferase [Gammaproteobacteria bacterium]